MLKQTGFLRFHGFIWGFLEMISFGEIFQHLLSTSSPEGYKFLTRKFVEFLQAFFFEFVSFTAAENLSDQFSCNTVVLK